MFYFGAGVKRSSASVCVSACPHDRTKSAETGYPFNNRSKGKRSRSHGHKVQKNIFQAIE